MERLVEEVLSQLDTQEREAVEQVSRNISVYAALTGSDLFIDCFPEGGTGIVVAHGRPETGSLYSRSAVGAKVSREREPMVYYTYSTGISMRGASALSQEDRYVVQSTQPLRCGRKVIAVLVQENDDTENRRRSDKLSRIRAFSSRLMDEKVLQERDSRDMDELVVQETHHRIKNNLQTISSILSLQRRRSRCAETKEALSDNIARINSMAAMYEIMTVSGGSRVDALEVLRRTASMLMDIYADGETQISVEVRGQSVILDARQAQALVLAVGELVQNACKHAFEPGSKGTITVDMMKTGRDVNVHVVDDGRAKDKNPSGSGLGLSIVRSLVEGDLKGSFSLDIRSDGATAAIRFEV